MRKTIIAANWKMNLNSVDALEYMDIFLEKYSDYDGSTEVVIIPPFTLLTTLKNEMSGLEDRDIYLGAQNLHWEEDGAYTGEISADMLVDAGCEYVIIGHSERREYFHETDEVVNLKITGALKKGLKPILCIGESKEEREKGLTLDKIKKQLDGALNEFSADDLKDLVIAYEPIWAIGTGLTATPEQAQEVHKFIREKMSEKFGSGFSGALRIQYGGSVKENNVKTLMNMEDIDGALVGGASLDPNSFFHIISFDK